LAAVIRPSLLFFAISITPFLFTPQYAPERSESRRREARRQPAARPESFGVSHDLWYC
jgi:hypothetical protein